MSLCSSIDSDLSENQDICRICHCEGEAGLPLIAPCCCSGSLRYVHQSCLQQWIKSSDTKCCELCRFPFIMHIKTKPIKEWVPLDMSPVEVRNLVIHVLMHLMVVLGMMLSLYMTVRRTLEEIQEGSLSWPFWTKLVVVAIGLSGGSVFMHMQCKTYMHLCYRWKAFNRVICVQSAPEKVPLCDNERAMFRLGRVPSGVIPEAEHINNNESQSGVSGPGTPAVAREEPQDSTAEPSVRSSASSTHLRATVNVAVISSVADETPHHSRSAVLYHSVSSTLDEVLPHTEYVLPSPTALTALLTPFTSLAPSAGRPQSALSSSSADLRSTALERRRRCNTAIFRAHSEIPLTHSSALRPTECSVHLLSREHQTALLPHTEAAHHFPTIVHLAAKTSRANSQTITTLNTSSQVPSSIAASSIAASSIAASSIAASSIAASSIAASSIAACSIAASSFDDVSNQTVHVHSTTIDISPGEANCGDSDSFGDQSRNISGSINSSHNINVVDIADSVNINIGVNTSLN